LGGAGDEVVEIHGGARGTPPGKIRLDNGTAFVSRVPAHWAYRHSVALDFPQPGKPPDNSYIESFNDRLRDECLNKH
jgi:putative transposase